MRQWSRNDNSPTMAKIEGLYLHTQWR